MYAFNISINESGNLIDFYDWNLDDNIIVAKKLPLFLVDNQIYEDLLLNDVTFSDAFVNTIEDKCELSNNLRKTIFIVCNGTSAFSISLNKRGVIINKSYLDILDELEVVLLSNNLSKYKISYVTKEYNYSFSNYTRSSSQKINNILNELEKLKNDNDKITYLCYEWFNNKNSNYDELVDDIKKSYSSKHDKFTELLNLICVNK